MVSVERTSANPARQPQSSDPASCQCKHLPPIKAFLPEQHIESTLSQGMLRNNIVPLALVAGCGIFTVVSTFQPELQKQRTGLGHSTDVNVKQDIAQEQDNAISSAIKADLEVARKELNESMAQPTGFAWGIRRALFSRSPTSSQEDAVTDVQKDGSKRG